MRAAWPEDRLEPEFGNSVEVPRSSCVADAALLPIDDSREAERHIASGMRVTRRQEQVIADDGTADRLAPHRNSTFASVRSKLRLGGRGGLAKCTGNALSRMYCAP